MNMKVWKATKDTYKEIVESVLEQITPPISKVPLQEDQLTEDGEDI